MRCAAIFIFGFLSFGMNVFAVQGNCPTGQYRVKAHHRKGYVKSDGIVVRPTTVKSHCRTLTKAIEYLDVRIKKGIPVSWPHKQEKIGSWNEEELENLRDALEEIPDELLDSKLDGIYRLKKSKDFPNPASSSDGVIVLYDSAFDSSRNIGEIFAHELSHQNYLDLSEQERLDYRRATGWHLELQSDRKFYWTGRKEGYIEEDGSFSPEEDYANNVEHFLYTPDKLKKVTPEAYSWIKNKFGEKFKLKGQKK
jgi:hypothetical protein